MNISSIALTGLEHAQTSLEKTAGRLARAGAPASAVEPPADTIDLSTEMVNLLNARRDFEANLNVVKIADRLEGSALDLIG